METDGCDRTSFHYHDKFAYNSPVVVSFTWVYPDVLNVACRGEQGQEYWLCNFHLDTRIHGPDRLELTRAMEAAVHISTGSPAKDRDRVGDAVRVVLRMKHINIDQEELND